MRKLPYDRLSKPVVGKKIFTPSEFSPRHAALLAGADHKGLESEPQPLCSNVFGPIESGIDSTPGILGSTLADINLPSQAIGVDHDVAAPLSAEKETLAIELINHVCMCVPRPLSNCEYVSELRETGIYMVCTSSDNDSLNMEILVTGEEHTYEPLFQRKIVIEMNSDFSSVRTTVRGRLVREAVHPVTVRGSVSLVLKKFIFDLHALEFYFDLCEASLGVGCERIRLIGFRNSAIKLLETSSRAFFDYVNQGKTHRSVKPNQEPEVVDSLRSAYARIDSLFEKCQEIEHQVLTLEGKQRDRAMTRLLLENDRVRRQIESLRRITKQIYPHLDFRVQPGFRYENHALPAVSKAIKSAAQAFSSEIYRKNVIDEAVWFTPTLLALIADGVSILHHFSKCVTKTDLAIFVAGLLGRFAWKSCVLDDMVTFVMDVVTEEWSEGSDFEFEYENQADTVVEVTCCNEAVRMFLSQWDLFKKILGIALIFFFNDAKQITEITTATARASVLWLLGFSADIRDLPKLLVSVFNEMSVRIYRFLTTGDFMAIFKESPPPLIQRALAFVNNGTSMLTNLEVMTDIILPMDMPELLAEGAKLINELNISIQTSSKTSDGMTASGYYYNVLKEVLATYRKLQYFNCVPNRRRMPFGLCMYGPAHVGKSEAVPCMYAVLMKAVAGVTYTPELATSINPVEAFQSTATSQHVGITLDDVGQVLDPEGKAYKLIFDIMTNVPFFYTKPGVEEKGTVPCRAQVLITTTNDPYMKAQGRVASLSAFCRRFVWCHMRLKDSCKRDGKFFPNPDHHNDWWVCSLEIRSPAASNTEEWDPHAIDVTYYKTTSGVVCKDVGFSVILDALFELGTQHRLNQEAMELVQANRTTTTMCDKCDSVVAFCKCPPVFENQGGFHSRYMRKPTRRFKHTERTLAEDSVEYKWYDRIWMSLPLVDRIENYFRDQLIGGHDSFVSVSKRLSSCGVGLSLLTMSLSGTGLCSAIVCLTSGVMLRIIKKVNYIRDVSSRNPTNKKGQEALVRRFCQFVTFGSVMVGAYTLFSVFKAFSSFFEKEKETQDDKAKTTVKVEPKVEESTEKRETLDETPKVVFVNQSTVDSAASASEGEVSSCEIPVGTRLHENLLTWRPFTDLTDMRKRMSGDLTIDYRTVERRIHDATCKVTTMCGDLEVTSVTGIFVKSNMLLVNNHAIQGNIDRLKISFQGGNKGCSIKTSPFHRKLVYVLKDATGGFKDAALVTITNAPALRDITMYFAQQVPDEVTAVLMRYEPESFQRDKVVAKLGFLKQPYDDLCGNTKYSDMSVWFYELKNVSQRGDCGSPLVTVGPTPMIVGIHACGYKQNSVSCMVLRNDILIGVEHLKTQSFLNHGYVFDLTNLPPVAEEENKLSFVHRLPPNSNISPLFPTTLPVIRPKFNTKDYGLMDHLQLKNVVKMSAPRKEPSWLRPYANLLVIGDDKKLFSDLDANTWAIEDYIYTIRSRLRPHALDKVRLLTLHEVLNGVPEEGILGMDFSKSAGFTCGKLGGPKSQYVDTDEHGVVTLKPELQEVYDAYEKQFWNFSDDHLPTFVTNMFAKDEARKVDLKTGLPKPYRSIFGFDFCALLFEQRVSKSLYHAISKQPLAFETALGANMYRDADAFRKYLKLDPKRKPTGNKSMFGDLEHFDQSKDMIVKITEIEVQTRVQDELCPLFSDADVEFSRRVLMAIEHSPVVMGAEVVGAIFGPSGKFGTFFHNCTSVSIHMRIGFKWKYPKAKVGDFGKNVRLITGGDDNGSNVISDAYEYGMMDVYEYAKARGVGFTDADKQKPAKQYDDNFNFFKRELRYVADQCKGFDHEFYVAALDKGSIAKTLMVGQRKIYEGNASPVEKELYITSAMSCVQESMLHGEDYYNEVCSAVKRVLKHWEVEHWVRDDYFESYDTRMADFANRMMAEAKERALDVF